MKRWVAVAVLLMGLLPGMMRQSTPTGMWDARDPELYLYQFGEKKTLPAGQGKVVYFTKYTKLSLTADAAISASLVALTEGTAATPGVISATRLTATAQGYGAAVGLSDFLIMTAINDTVTGALGEVSKVLALRMEQVIEGTLSAQGTIIRGSAVAANAVTTATPIFATDIIRSVTTLRSTDAKTFPDGNFVGRFHPNQIHQLQTDTKTGGWIDVVKYTSNVDRAYRGEIGQLYGVRAVMSSNVPLVVSDANNSVALTAGALGSGYMAYIFGPGAYGVVDLEGGSASTYVKQLGSGGTSDPLNQLATVGARVYFAALNIDQTNRFIRLIGGNVLT